LTGSDVTVSLLGYVAVYLLIYPSGLLLILRLVRKGPLETSEAAPVIEAGRPAAPVLAAAINVVKGEVR
jgi:cytochrome d ubiquinol oxidase subunit I